MSDFWPGKKVLLTGHTGFKGAWLTLLLKKLGAKVYGYALSPDDPSLFRSLELQHCLDGEKLADIGDSKALESFIRATAPDITIHMAAQALVLPSYADPVETFRVNVVGTAVLLDAVRRVGLPQTVIIVTSDKVYKNLETGRPYSETDALGGNDPYSASKACAELVAHSFRHSFFAHRENGVTIKTARAGNVIGGGDWSPHRLVPDIVRSIGHGQDFTLRNPASVRPWQHVLEPLSGYVLLAEKTAMAPRQISHDSFNFGPDLESCRPTGEIVERLTSLWGQKPVSYQAAPDQPKPHEAHLLHLDSSRARESLGWKPRWTLDQALAATVAGYKAVLELPPEQARAAFVSQIDDYFQKS